MSENDRIQILENQMDLLLIKLVSDKKNLQICPYCNNRLYKTDLTNICEKCGMENNRKKEYETLFLKFVSDCKELIEVISDIDKQRSLKSVYKLQQILASVFKQS